jgi:trehalose synthase
LHEVQIEPMPLERLASVLSPERQVELADSAVGARNLLRGLTVWNVNSTASGGGVAEMLQALLAYTRGAGISTRWLVLEGSRDFFTVTKRIHNLVHGSSGDGGPTGHAETAVYEQVLAGQLDELRTLIPPGDVVILHDPQTAGLAAGLRDHGAHVVWRCHVGRDTSNEATDRAWSFLHPYVAQVEATIFSRRTYAPSWVDHDRLWVIPPSLDPFSTKNRPLSRGDVRAALREAGIVAFRDRGGRLDFVRRDGRSGAVRARPNLAVTGGPLPATARAVLQVSRWDRLKDMAGVLSGIADHLDHLPEEVHLLLVGPDASGVSDDPEAADVLAECQAIWSSRPAHQQRRLHLCSLPMDDVDENAHLVNALQHHAATVVQKSLVEGFGLTVTEPMWKARPVVASAVGGIQDQIVDGESGLLLDDPENLDGFASLVGRVLSDAGLATRLGDAARERVRDQFLGDRHLRQYVDLLEQLLGSSPPRS